MELTQLSTEICQLLVNVDDALRVHSDSLDSVKDVIYGSGGPPGLIANQKVRLTKTLEERIPDPCNWALDVLKDGEKEWVEWRKSFELQVRSLWVNLDNVF